MSEPRDANGVTIRPGVRIRLMGTVELAPETGMILFRPHRQPEGQRVSVWIDPRVLEVWDE